MRRSHRIPQGPAARAGSRMLAGAAVATASLAVLASSALAAPPANDTFAQAAPVGATGLVAGTLAGATHEAGEAAHAGFADSPSVWFAYTPATTGRVDVGGIPFEDAIVAVYTGTTLADLRPVTTGVPDPESDAFARAAFDAQAGTRYWIAVAAARPPAAETVDRDFELRVRPAPLPANDTFAAARTVRVPGIVRGSLLDATGELGEPRITQRAAVRSLWYRFAARYATRYTIDATASSARPVIAVYRGAEPGSLRGLGRGSDPAIVRFTARKGETYRIQVDALALRGGDVALEISDGSLAAKGVEVAVADGQSVASLRARGLKLQVATRREAAVALELRVDARTQRRLGLATPVLGRTRGALEPGERVAADIPLRDAARRALRGRQVLRATVRVSLLTQAPNRVATIDVDLPD